jgi:hypothetical protein
MELKTIATYVKAYEAELARGFLESNGIAAFVGDEMISRVVSYLAIAGGYKLQVRAADEAAARELLASIRPGPMLVQ